MSNILKVFVVLNFVLAVVFVATSATLLGKADNWMGKYQELEKTSNKQVADLTEQLGASKALVNTKEQARQDAVSVRADLEGNLQSTSERLIEQKRTNEKLGNTLAELKDQMKTLTANLKQAQTDRETYEKRATTADESARGAVAAKETAENEARRQEAVIAQMKEEAAQFERDLNETRKQLSHTQNLVKVAQSKGFDIADAIITPSIEAVVQKVNGELKYVMLSVGADDKVVKGFRFVVSRNGRYVGDVQVDYVYPKACAASFVRMAPGFSFEPGDTASTRP